MPASHRGDSSSIQVILYEIRVWESWHWNRFCFKNFGFPLSVSFHRCYTRMFINKLLLPHPETGEAWERFGNRGASDTKVLSLF